MTEPTVRIGTGPTVRIGIVSWNTADHLGRCLAALRAATTGMRTEVVVVDNDSVDASVEVAAAGADRVVRNPTNVGYARAMNQALDGPGVDVLIALNPDTVPPPGSLAVLVGRLLGDPELALVAPRLQRPDGGDQHSAYRFPSPAVAATVGLLPVRWHRGAVGRRMGLEGSGMPSRPTDVDWVIGAVHVIRPAALGPAKPYDERWFMYVEDLELCWRLRQAGWRIRLEADVVVSHVGDAAGSQAWGARRARRWLDATYDWYARDRGMAAMRGWAALNVVGVIVHLAGSLGGRALGRDPQRRVPVRTLVGALPAHVRALVAGPPPPDPHPPPRPRPSGSRRS